MSDAGRTHLRKTNRQRSSFRNSTCCRTSRRATTSRWRGYIAGADDQAETEVSRRSWIARDRAPAGSQAERTSGGEQQRVAIARAIVNQPAILLADEPTGNLDTENSQAVLDMLRDLNQRLGQTVLMITHNPEAAAYRPPHRSHARRPHHRPLIRPDPRRIRCRAECRLPGSGSRGIPLQELDALQTRSIPAKARYRARWRPRQKVRRARIRSSRWSASRRSSMSRKARNTLVPFDVARCRECRDRSRRCARVSDAGRRCDIPGAMSFSSMLAWNVSNRMPTLG